MLSLYLVLIYWMIPDRETVLWWGVQTTPEGFFESRNFATSARNCPPGCFFPPFRELGLD
jgi:hypothetical protein